ncbi:uncharacterized protein LOC126673333 isoform X2 [Mercurialis annua]|uniref:uncharacterized protein LOC126673333 isoform X2 n=1 Tax=Mercurialis annua TaxID=3986 RepID=UPI00215DFF68|nr:uncharacterized protein LOC126673333 isoform X2 [Mercurialis annua]
MGSEYIESNISTDVSTEQEAQCDVLTQSISERVAQKVQKLRSEAFLLEKRISPRLKNIPKDKRPFYGSVTRKRSHTSEAVTATDNISPHAPEIGSERSLLNRRLSPRFRGIPVNKRPYYGSVQRRKSYASKDLLHDRRIEDDDWKRKSSSLNENADMEKNKADIYVREQFLQKVPKMRLDVSPLQQTVGQRSESIILGKRLDYSNENGLVDATIHDHRDGKTEDKKLYYGSNHNIKLNSSKDHVCSNNDQRMQLHSPKNNSVKKKAIFDWVIEKCIINVARKDICDPDTPSWVTSKSADKYENAEIMHLENGEDLKSMGYKKFVADHMCQSAGARVKQKDYFGRTRASSRIRGYVCEDISNGKEDIPIPVTNLIDPPLAPTDFTYIKSIQVASNVIVPSSPSGCNCKGSCTNPKTCCCARLNGSDFPYVCEEDGGRLIEPKDVVFECGPGCGCGPNCINRVSQRGIKYRLEVYRTRNKGWAVRSRDLIPSGAFVCEYIGVLMRSADLENVSENDYIFEIDCWHTMHGIEGRERRQGDVSKHGHYLVNKAQNETEFCIDGGSYSNVTRFINHSCDPNLFVQCVLSSCHDIRFARIVLFAADDIPPLQELAYDYGYALDSVIGSDGKIKKSPCYCGTSECRGRLY